MTQSDDAVNNPRNPLAELPVVLFFLALAGLVFYETGTSFVEQGAASGGAMFNAALYPEILGWVLIVFSAVRLVDIGRATIRARRLPKAPEADGPVDLRKALMWTGLVVVYLICLKPLGYHLTTPVFMFACFFLLGTRNLILAAGLAILASLTMSFMFEYLLNVILPVGMFGIGF